MDQLGNILTHSLTSGLHTRQKACPPNDSHRLDAYHPDDSAFGFKVDQSDQHHSEIIQRLINYFHRQYETMNFLNIKANKDMWAMITNSHEPFRAALMAGDKILVSDMLLNVAVGSLVAGFMNIEPYERLKAKLPLRLIEAKHFADKLLSLSQSLGISTVQCIEQGTFGYETIDLDAMVAAVQTAVGFDIRPPSAGGGSFGFKTAGSVLCIKDLYAIYAAERVSNLTKQSDNRAIAEIGGGTGTLAYYLVKAGLPRVTVYDLPIVSVIQGYYLMRSLGPANVWLHGEAPSEAKARVQPFWTLQDEADGSVGLFVNQDSLPEIEREAAMQYLRLFRSKGAALFSINQEGQAKDDFANPQSVVFRLAEAAGGFHRQYRFPYWMRLGYVEEFYRFLP